MPTIMVKVKTEFVSFCVRFLSWMIAGPSPMFDSRPMKVSRTLAKAIMPNSAGESKRASTIETRILKTSPEYLSIVIQNMPFSMMDFVSPISRNLL